MGKKGGGYSLREERGRSGGQKHKRSSPQPVWQPYGAKLKSLLRDGKEAGEGEKLHIWMTERGRAKKADKVKLLKRKSGKACPMSSKKPQQRKNE